MLPRAERQKKKTNRKDRGIYKRREPLRQNITPLPGKDSAYRYLTICNSAISLCQVPIQVSYVYMLSVVSRPSYSVQVLSVYT